MGAQALATDVKRTLEWVTRMRWEQVVSGPSLIYLDSQTPTPVRVFCQTSSGGTPDVGVGMRDSKSFQSVNGDGPSIVRRRLGLAVWKNLLEAGYNEVRPLEDILREWLMGYYGDLADGLRCGKGLDKDSVILGGDLVVSYWWRASRYRATPRQNSTSLKRTPRGTTDGRRASTRTPVLTRPSCWRHPTQFTNHAERT